MNRQNANPISKAQQAARDANDAAKRASDYSFSLCAATKAMDEAATVADNVLTARACARRN